ncbi:hypothetical protein M0813_24465 [Anaeramoeba flamelloides]|uniref:Uncharacterized protein n=1 Tax=Anaeramoeba flamelloides TaxID=1746091 RepID=A0ABQ8Y685_9EUKA|nr:hypothetical protein M0813_24465 [Anaeramoeba flamelloides]
MTVLLEQYIYSLEENNIVDEFCVDRETRYFHFDTKEANRKLRSFILDKNKNRISFQHLINSNGLHNLQISLSMHYCLDLNFDQIIQKSLDNNSKLKNQNKWNKTLKKKFIQESKHLRKFQKVFNSLTDLEKIAIGLGKEIPDLSVDMILKLTKLKNHN